MVGQASSLSIRDDGQSRVSRGTSHRQSERRSKEKMAFPRLAGLAMTGDIKLPA